MKTYTQIMEEAQEVMEGVGSRHKKGPSAKGGSKVTDKERKKLREEDDEPMDDDDKEDKKDDDKEDEM